MPAITTQGLSKTYSGKPPVEALQPLDLDVEAGEIFGLLGPNGAGKTTLVKLLLGLAHPTAGNASLFGVDARRPEARADIGFLPESHRFPEHLTARQTLALYGRLSGVSPDECEHRAPGLLERVRLTDAADRRVRTFSKGMMQRLGLAQALLHRPRLVFLDEPTDGVDPLGRKEIRDLLEELRADGVTLFLNSHLLSEIERVCSRVAILNRGRLVRQGTLDELTRAERVWRLRSTSIPAETQAALGEALYAPEHEARPEESLRTTRVHADSRASLNALLDTLRSAGVEIESVEPARQSLEDLFVETISSDAPPADSPMPAAS